MKAVDQTLADAAQKRALIERALAPSRTMADVVRLIQGQPFQSGFERLAKGIHPARQFAAVAEIAKAMHPPAHLTALSQMMTAMERQQRQFAAVLRSPHFLGDIGQQMQQMLTLGQRIAAPYQAIEKMMRSQASLFEGLGARVAALNAGKLSIAQFSQAKLAWNVASIGLVNRIRDIGLLSRRQNLSARLLEFPRAYSEFAGHTIDRLAGAPNLDIAARLRGSLNLAEQQLLGIADSVSAFVTVSEDEQEPDAIRILDAPYEQQEELLTCKVLADENEAAALTSVSPTAGTVQAARRVLELVIQCNEAGRTSTSGVEIFKPTTRLMTVFGDLPWLSATDRLRFGDVVDCLYFIFYEGAGKDNLRFLDKNGGPLMDADCDLIWCIKHLRNKWSRHDADHGEEKDIQKSWAQLAAKFRWLGLAEHPTEKRHFQQLQIKLLELGEEFLKRILSKLTLKP